MPNHRSRFPIDSSDPPKDPGKTRPHKKRRGRKLMRKLTKKVEAVHLGARMRPRQTPTWTQVRHLTSEAREVLKTARVPETASLMFVAMLAVMGASVSRESYWAYIPKPPVLHPLGWGTTDHIKILTNQTFILGGSPDFHNYKNSSGYVDYEGNSDSLPICFSFTPATPIGCFQVGKRVLNADTPTVDNTKPDGKGDKRRMWELWISTLENPKSVHTFLTSKELPSRFPHCRAAYKKDALWEGDEVSPPHWLRCAFPDHGIRFIPFGASEQLWDFSISSPDADQSRYLKDNKNLYSNYVPPVGRPVHSWYDAGWIEPTWFWESSSPTGKKTPLVEHPDLFRLIAASEKISLKRPLKEDYETISASACVSYPHALLVGLPQLVTIDKIDHTFTVKCTSCMLTNCIDSSASGSVILIVKRPPYVLLPVDLGNEPWYDDSALQTFKYANSLLRTKRFVAALILGISALIAIITSFALSTTALVKEMQTASFVNNLHRNITLALSEQRIIDLKLEARLNALEEVILELGQDIANIKTRMSTRCHANYNFICVTPLPYNASKK